MKKQHKFVLLLLALFLISGVFLLPASADGTAAVSDENIFTPSVTLSAENQSALPSDSSSVLGINSGNRLDNDIVSGFSFNKSSMDWLSFYSATDAGSSNAYLLARANKDYTTNGGNNYIQVNTKATQFTIGDNATAYYVVDIDIGTLTELIPEIDIQCMNRQTSTGSGFPFSSQVKLGQYLENNEEWAHFTLVGDIKNDTLYTFLNGDLVFTGKSWGTNGTGANGSNGQDHLYHMGFRFEFRTNATTARISENNTVLIDDPSVRFFSSDPGNLATAINNGKLTDWSLYYAGRGGKKLPAAATVDGVDYCNENNFLSLISSGEASGCEIEIKRELYSDFTIDFPCTLNTNGYEGYDIAPGYMVNSISGNVYSIEKTDLTHPINIVVNGVEVCTKQVTHGAALGTFLNDVELGGTLVWGNGEVYKNVTWDGVDMDTRIYGECTVAASGTKVTTFFAHNGTSELSFSTFSAAVSSSSTANIILASDITLSGASTLTSTKHIYLNNNSITQSDGSVHTFTPSNNTNIVFEGPGTINQPNATSTHSIVFTSESNTAAYVEFNGVTVNTTHHFLQMRTGHAVVRNCVVNAFGAFTANMITVGEKSAAPATVDIIDSELNFTHNAASGAIFRHVVHDTYPDTMHHVVNITGSTLISQTSLFDISKTENFTVNVTDSSIVGSSLINNQLLGTINFNNNVYVNKSMQNVDKASKDGLILVKSNNHLAPLCYASSYATVTWADNSVEYWADGSTPVRSGKFPIVDEVAAGESYDFIEGYDTAPFALKANLTLGSEIAFNLYTTKNAVSCITVEGEIITSEDKSIDGTVYDCFTLKLKPSEAASAFDVIFTLSDGNKIARTLSVADYAELLYKANVNTATRELLSATLYYIKASAGFFGVNADTSKIEALISANPVFEASIPVETSDTSALSGYIDSVQLDIMSTLKFRFNLVSGASGTGLSFSVNGEEVDCTVTDSYCEIELRAYEMADTITISADGVSCTYSLAVYLTSASELAESSNTTPTAKKCKALFDSTRGNLASAIYSYAIAARVYSPEL